MSTADTDTTKDTLLGGRVSLTQPKRGFRAGSDPVLLAASVPARSGQRVLDLGCGAGAAFLCLAARVPGLSCAAVELQADYADLARVNAARNGADAMIHTADIAALPAELRRQRFHHVLTNPPYFDRRTGSTSPDLPRERALGEVLALPDWIDAGARRLEPRGTLTVIQKADRLPDLLTAMAACLGSVAILPIAPRIGQQSKLVIAQGIKGGRAPFRLLPPFILHDADDFSDAASAVLRDAAPIRSFSVRMAQQTKM